MTKTAMNNTLRIKVAVKDNKALIEGFKKFGYRPYFGSFTCEACEDELLTAAQAVGYTGDTPPWANAKIALRFKKNGHTIAACKCGWRKDVTSKSIKKPVCTECGTVINADGKCYNPNCTSAHTAPIASKVCNRVNCNNPVPSGRTAVCYSCLPPSASSQVTM